MPNIILASASSARKKMLENAGLNFISIPADIDEKNLLQEMQKQRKLPRQMAENLAEQKAVFVSKNHPEAIVIGSDQVLECEGKIFSKAATKEEARQKLLFLQGKNHRLISSVCVAQKGQTVWASSEEALLSMPKRDEKFLDAYCTRAETVLTSCVGAYAIEEHGAWLFEKIEGDYFTILGMPLLPLLKFLYEKCGVLP